MFLVKIGLKIIYSYLMLHFASRTLFFWEEKCFRIELYCLKCLHRRYGGVAGIFLSIENLFAYNVHNKQIVL